MQVIKTTDNSNTISKYIEAMQIKIITRKKNKEHLIGKKTKYNLLSFFNTKVTNIVNLVNLIAFYIHNQISYNFIYII